MTGAPLKGPRIIDDGRPELHRRERPSPGRPCCWYRDNGSHAHAWTRGHECMSRSAGAASLGNRHERDQQIPAGGEGVERPPVRAFRGPWSRRRDARTTTKTGLRRPSRAGRAWLLHARASSQPGRQTDCPFRTIWVALGADEARLSSRLRSGLHRSRGAIPSGPGGRAASRRRAGDAPRLSENDALSCDGYAGAPLPSW